ncbi:MAG: hypothetical protein GVY18_05210 [Bacteroidetes bacterium]|jgi:hypothetical protein|nr:hypothetical protein [Bacteroidota bacterium]
MADLNYIASNILLGPRTDWSGRRWWLASKSSNDPNKEFEVGVAGGAEAGLVFDTYAAACSVPCSLFDGWTRTAQWDVPGTTYDDLDATQEFGLRVTISAGPNDHGRILLGYDGTRVFELGVGRGHIYFVAGEGEPGGTASRSRSPGSAVRLSFPIRSWQAKTYEIHVSGFAGGGAANGALMYVNCVLVDQCVVDDAASAVYGPSAGITYLPWTDRFTGSIISPPEVYAGQHLTACESVADVPPAELFWHESYYQTGAIALWLQGFSWALQDFGDDLTILWGFHYKEGDEFDTPAQADDLVFWIDPAQRPDRYTEDSSGVSGGGVARIEGIDPALTYYARAQQGYTDVDGDPVTLQGELGPLVRAFASKADRPPLALAMPSSGGVLLLSAWGAFEDTLDEVVWYRHTAPFSAKGDASATISHPYTGDTLRSFFVQQRLGGLTLAMLDTTAVPGTEYYYRVAHVYDDGTESDLSRPARVFDASSEVDPDVDEVPVAARPSPTDGLTHLADWYTTGDKFELTGRSTFSFRVDLPQSPVPGVFYFESGSKVVGCALYVLDGELVFQAGDGQSSVRSGDRLVTRWRPNGVYNFEDRQMLPDNLTVEGSVSMSKGMALYVNGVLVDTDPRPIGGTVSDNNAGGVIGTLGYDWIAPLGPPPEDGDEAEAFLIDAPGVVLYEEATADVGAMTLDGTEQVGSTGQYTSAGTGLTVNLWWEAMPGSPTGYEIYRSTQEFDLPGDPNVSLVDTVVSAPTEASPYVDTVPAPGIYYYRIVGLYAEGSSQPGELLTVLAGSNLTDGMTLDATWSDPATDYADLANVQAASAYVEVELDLTSEGYIMEAGGGGIGLAWYVMDGKLYFQTGDGSNPNNAAECVWEIIPGTYRLEWSADAASGVVMAVNGVIVASSAMSETKIAGGNPGGPLPDSSDDAPDTRLATQSTAFPFANGLVSDILVFVGETVPEVAQVPTAPTGLTATAAYASVELHWTAVTGADTYRIYRATSSFVDVAGATLVDEISSAPTSGSPFVDEDLDSDETYYYRVSTVDSGLESALSSEVSASPDDATPTGLTGLVGDGLVDLWWDDYPPDASEFRVYSSSTFFSDPASAILDGTPITPATPEDPYRLGGLTNGQDYYVRITSVVDGIESPLSGFFYSFIDKDRATKDMTVDAVWDDDATAYNDLDDATAFSAFFNISIDSADEGVILEAGSSAFGVLVYALGGTLYAQAGDGGGHTSQADRAVVSWPISNGNKYFEISADAAKGLCLYVDGTLVDSDTMTAAKLSDTDAGGIEQVHGADSAQGQTTAPYDWRVESPGALIYLGETTSDVQNL